MRFPSAPPIVLALLLLSQACSSADSSSGSSPSQPPLPDAAPADAPPSDDAAQPGDSTAPDGSSPDADADSLADAAACSLVRPYSQLDPVCNACAEQHCCDEINACLLDPACDDSFVNCMLACSLDADAGTIQPCIDDCAAQYPAGKAEYDVAIGCADSKCAAECQ